MTRITSILFAILFSSASVCLSDDGYQLWLRYSLIDDENVIIAYRHQLRKIEVKGEGPTLQLLREELDRGISGMLGTMVATHETKASFIIGVPDHSEEIRQAIPEEAISALGPEGFILKYLENGTLILTAESSIGLYYGVFHLFRLMSQEIDLQTLNIVEIPRIQIRMLNHWDNLDRTSERGYAGFAIWDWHKLPEYIDPRYHDYARANASIGINGTVLTNVNANALALTPQYLKKMRAMADLFRPYGIKLYLTARFSAPMDIGGLDTADPLDSEVQQWWNEKIKEIYSLIPDFGGFVVKANSEGQPGPHDFGRTHADGANMFARSLREYGGIVMWRAFVYSETDPEDRHKQAYSQFVPLDGKFEANAILQVKNGPIDFQPREPFHPLFGAMKKTPLMMEFQITQEYLGQGSHLVYLGPLFEEVLKSDTYVQGNGSTISSIIDGSLFNSTTTAIAGVANIGTDRNWTGHLFGQSNWYAFGRFAWDHSLSSSKIAEEWIGMTFDHKSTYPVIKDIMMTSREALVNYMTPLGLHHLMATGHHYGPGPWVSNLSRPEWNPTYYHRADKEGLGFDRTVTGSFSLGQYTTEIQQLYGPVDSCPEELLLWFHHISWDYKMSSGQTLWDELAFRYQSGVKRVREYISKWESLESSMDQERFEQVSMLLRIQLKEAIWWKDACLLYFQQFSGMDFPEGIETPEKSLEYYQSLEFPNAPGIKPRW